jgi:hypothetical protein
MKIGHSVQKEKRPEDWNLQNSIQTTATTPWFETALAMLATCVTPHQHMLLSRTSHNALE